MFIDIGECCFPNLPEYTGYVLRLNRLSAVFPRLAELLVHKY